MDKYTDIQQEATDDRIDAFIRCAMTEDEEAAFKQEILSNQELRIQVLTTLSLIKGIRKQNDEKDSILRAMAESVFEKQDQIQNWNCAHMPDDELQIKRNDVEEETRNGNEIKPKINHRSIFLWACSIAAMFVIFFGVKNELRYRKLSGIVSPYYSEYSTTDYSRGDVDSVTVAHLYTLFNNIRKQRNISEIIEEIELIYYSLDNDFTYVAYANDIAWNLALAYIKDDQIDKAILILEKLEEDNQDMPIATKASELKKKLQE